MRIKRVAIHGFKTFARSTEFIFDPGTTAVVGPNGSGKSNIVDAVRWCLGEQSFSLLRSKKTSDVIFAGSDKKARLGMAEVTITLDNSAGEIPIDFTEVEITRRAYRDGDNEYLVNGQRVRLQDVVDLLSQTGLGKRTYSVVGQGLIDRALSMAPEERRALFEEAAGISGYQIKRVTTVRRLEATQQNLTRVQDIVAELSPRLGYLRRQADRAREREQLVGDLQLLLRDWYGFRWHTTLRHLEEHHAVEQAARVAVETRQAVLAAAGVSIEELRTRQRDLRTTLADLHGSGSGLHQEAERVGRDLAVVQERVRQLQARQEDAQRDLGPLEVEQSMLVKRSSDLAAAVVEAQRTWEARQRDVDALQADVASRQQERTRVLGLLDTARRELKRTQDQQTGTRGRLAQLLERRAALLAQQTQQEQAVRAAQAEVEATAKAVEAADALTNVHDQRVVELQEAQSTAEQELGALRSRLRTAEDERQGADRALDRLQTRLDLLSRLRNDGAGYASGVRSVLQATHLKGILGTVASLLRVPPNLEKAIETALGGALQNVVAERWVDATAGIEWLKQQRAGRATFLPLDRLSVLPAIPAPRTLGILGNALDLVEYDPRIDEAARQLLNRVWVAEDLPSARAALDGIRGGSRPTVVTLGGEIVRPGGAVTGGAEGSRHDESLLARERELRELPDQVATATATAKSRAQSCRDLNSAIETSRLRQTEIVTAIAEAARQEKQDRQRLDEVRRRADHARQAQRYQEERLAQTATEFAALAVQEEELRVIAGNAQTAEAAASAQVAELEAQLATTGSDDLLHELANRRAGAAEAQGHLRSQQSLLENTQRTQRALQEQMANKRAQLERFATGAEELGEQVAVLRGEEAELSKRIEALQARITPFESELAELERNLNAEQQQERVLQGHLRKEESAWNNAQLHLQRSEDALHQLRGEIEQDLGLVALEQSDEVAYQPPLPWDAFVEQLPIVESVPDGLEDEVRELRARLARIGSVNPDAPREFDEAFERHGFLLAQSQDLAAAMADLQKVIKELDERMQIELRRTFDAVAIEFTRLFQQLFNGGTAQIELTDPEHIAVSGIDIVARPPGKRPQSLALLSGGERALAAVALIFAILRVSPTPFCVLDEVDAALDEANIDRFRLLLEEMSRETQFIIVTHNRRTLEGANTIYGVTMGGDGVSRVMSLRLEGDRIIGHNDGPGEEPIPQELEEVVKL